MTQVVWYPDNGPFASQPLLAEVTGGNGGVGDLVNVRVELEHEEYPSGVLAMENVPRCQQHGTEADGNHWGEWHDVPEEVEAPTRTSRSRS